MAEAMVEMCIRDSYDPEAGTISIAPEVDRYVFRSAISDQPGMENSLAVYDHYGYFVDNSGLLQCVALNALTCVWACLLYPSWRQ